MGTSSVLQCVNGRLEIKRLRYAAVYWRTLDGLQLLCSLVVDSITSPCIETVERGFPANLISEITNHCVLDHLNLISVACKDHNTLLPPCSASISPPPSPLPALPLQVSQDQRKTEEHADKTGVSTRRGQENAKHCRQRSNDALNGCRFITRGWQWAGRGGLDGSYL